MTYRFQSKAAGDVLMLGPAGDSVMRAMGLEPVDKGILQPQAMPAAIQAIEAAIVREEALQPAQPSVATEVPDGADGSDPVSLRQRAWPLVEMMRRAHAAGEAIVWGV